MNPSEAEKIIPYLFLFLLLTILISGLYLYSSKEETPVVAETVRVTIPEGYNVRQIGNALEKSGMFSAGEFIKKATPLEGFLFPDTYEFYKNTSPERVIKKMRDNFDVKVSQRIKPDLEKEKKNIADIIIMASILEEEAASLKDRKIISGILWKRVAGDMLLQVDATLNYVTGKISSELGDEDLKSDTPYNTYRFLGLPPGPISNPGLEAIDAALYPELTAYWYYLSDAGGLIHYAKTFEEHKINKIKYLR